MGAAFPDRELLDPSTLPAAYDGLLGAETHDNLIRTRRFETVLDVGCGAGKHADLFEAAGKMVTRFDFGRAINFTDESGRVLRGDFVTYDFKNQYDLIWASHVLEHTVETHAFLKKLRVVCKPDGLIAIIVPPAKPDFVGGHVTLWTPALLLYRMVLAGFDCAQAECASYGYNISVVVPNRPNDVDLSELAWDYDDIERLKKWFPPEIAPSMDGDNVGKVYKGYRRYFR